MEAHVDRESERHALPGRHDAQGDDHQVEPSGIDHFVERGADGISKDSGPFHLSPGFVEEGVVDIQQKVPLLAERHDQGFGQVLPQLSHGPLPGSQEAMVGIVGMLMERVAHGDDTRHGSSSGT